MFKIIFGIPYFVRSAKSPKYTKAHKLIRVPICSGEYRSASEGYGSFIEEADGDRSEVNWFNANYKQGTPLEILQWRSKNV